MNGGINLYAYVKNSPINFIDPFGLRITGVWEGSINFDIEIGLNSVHVEEPKAKLLPPSISLARVLLDISLAGSRQIRCTETDECDNVISEWNLTATATGETQKNIYVWITPTPSLLLTIVGMVLHAGGEAYNVLQHVDELKARVAAEIAAQSPDLFCKGYR